jgi:hypothetical protein
VRQRSATAVIVVLLGVMPVAAGCSRDAAAGRDPTVGAASTPAPAATSSQADDAEVAVYVEVLRRYLATPAENSFPGHTFTHVYVLDRAVPGAADPMDQGLGGTPIAPATRDRITAALSGLGAVSFIADKNTVIVDDNGCPQVRDGGILITLGPLNRAGDRVEVGIHGFVACLGATWLTYVVVNDAGSGWRVTGTTGPMAIS